MYFFRLNRERWVRLFMASAFIILTALIIHAIAGDDRMIIDTHDKRIQYTGRFDLSVKGESSFGWSASAVTIRYKGRSCAFLVKGDTDDNYVQIISDGIPGKAIRVTQEGVRAGSADLPDGEHVVTLFKRTEANQGILCLAGIELPAGTELLDPPVRRRLIEFVGDSITCGYGNEAKRREDGFSPDIENAYLSYASVCARRVSADCVTVCYSGKGVIRDYSGSPVEPMTRLYGRVYPQKDARSSIHEPADVAVINLGTNDFAIGAPDAHAFVTAYTELVAQIRKNNPDADIVIIDGPIMNNEWPFKGALTLFRTYRDKIIAQCAEKGLGNITYFSLSTQGTLGYGADSHPSIAQHEKNRRELAGYIRKLKAWN